MKYQYNKQLKGMTCQPDCVEEWLDAIWEYGCDYDGENTVDGLKHLIDELVKCSCQAKECLKNGKIFYNEEEDWKNLAEARNNINC